jgi:hypothetical protein
MELTCPHCRHVVDAAPGASVSKCSNCGALLPAPGSDPSPTSVPSDTPLRPPPSTADGLAIASLVFGLLFFVPVLTQVLAIAFGLGALLRRRLEGRRRAGLAWVGLLLGLFLLFGWIYVFVRAAWAGSVTPAGVGYASLGYSRYAAVDADEAALDELQAMTSVLGALYPAIEAYRRDFGAWPASLEVLTPVYLSAATAEAARKKALSGDESCITLQADVDPARDPPDRVIAYSAPVHVDDAGERLAKPHRWVLRLNGTTSFVPSDEVDAVIGSSASPLPPTTEPGAPTR